MRWIKNGICVSQNITLVCQIMIFMKVVLESGGEGQAQSFTSRRRF